MAYFEVFFSWSKVQLQSVFGNFLKEVFVRAVVSILLLLVYLDVITVDFFLKGLVGAYLLRTIIMKVYAYSLRFPKLRFDFPQNSSSVLKYSGLMILGASAAVLVLEIDRFMINQFIRIENVAYYSVAIFIAVVIAVPSRAMHQITYPLTAELLNKKDLSGLKQLYRKSSLTLFIAAGLVFVLIVLNLTDLYTLLPEAYRGGFTVVFLIGLAKVYDALLGNNNAILFSSDYYKTVLVFGAFLAVLTVIFNLWLIPIYGLEGAAIATFLAIFLYNTTKVIFVKLKFGFLPLSPETFKIAGLLIFIGFLFYFLQFPFHPIINIILKSALIVVMYVGVLFRFKISSDVFGILSRFLKR
ncbi:MAG: polysaccharide biosynthesis C-terminal domain-containing protein [Bacteroidota bacterium]